jgi:hypothetical protein
MTRADRRSSWDSVRARHAAARIISLTAERQLRSLSRQLNLDSSDELELLRRVDRAATRAGDLRRAAWACRRFDEVHERVGCCA